MPVRSRSEDIGIGIDLLRKRPVWPDADDPIPTVRKSFASTPVVCLLAHMLRAVDEDADTRDSDASIIEVGLQEDLRLRSVLGKIREAQLSLVEVIEEGALER